ncbi:hypothetical protein N9W34_01265 [Rickettsiales bacterium]|nr:hypothetical protein [Rickettsiales bacterium]
MGDLIYIVFNYLTDVSVNFWFWLLLFTAPVLVFSVKPEVSIKIRFLRLFFAIGFTYILMNLSLHTSRHIEWATYEACQSQFPDGGIQHHAECGEINIADGASNIFYAFFGWIPATVYVGMWELLWVVFYRKKIKNIGINYKGRRLSKIIIAFPIFFLVIFPITAIIGGLIAKTING